MNRRALLQNSFLLLGGIGASGLLRALEGGLPPPPGADLSEHQFKVCASLAELIIPRTETPGAVDAGVPGFIRHLVVDWYTELERGIFLEGIARLDAHCIQAFGKGYLDCQQEQQVACLQRFEDEALDYAQRNRRPPTPESLYGKGEIDQSAPFFSKLKELVVIGYFSSELVCKGQMKYLPVPGRYDGEATLQDSDGKQYVW